MYKELALSVALTNGTHDQANSAGAEALHTAVLSQAGRNTRMTPGDISTVLHSWVAAANPQTPVHRGRQERDCYCP